MEYNVLEENEKDIRHDINMNLKITKTNINFNKYWETYFTYKNKTKYAKACICDIFGRQPNTYREYKSLRSYFADGILLSLSQLSQLSSTIEDKYYIIKQEY